ncbi:VanW family protein [Cellulomonas sp. B6]|uniref:VanW family protein n=1 Tax=Cellulomonas sp. B6 TaxID=1295626 RepID=UPI00073B1654|nr:VanW family protein [Cellulomonas sp. B6]KSW29600.1 hypothetical protein ATM99_07265 [Cellulomonas sp. B6]
MTHGTDRDGPDEHAAGDPAVPGGPREDGAADPRRPVAAGDAAADTVAGDAAADTASGDTAADEPATPDVGSTAGGEQPPARRALAPEPAAPLTAWPSWDDVAVTAPVVDDAPGEDAPAEDARIDDASPADADADATPLADAPDADAVAAGTPDADAVAAETPDADAAARDEHGDEVVSGQTPAAADDAPAAAPRAAGPVDLSALAFAALNAAAVGVPAHALPRSPLDAGGARADDGAADDPTVDDPGSDAPAADAPISDEPIADDPTSDDPGDVGPDDPGATGSAAEGGDATDAAAAPATSPEPAASDVPSDDGAAPTEPAPEGAAPPEHAEPRSSDATAVMPRVDDGDAPRTAASPWPATTQGAAAAPGAPGGPVVRTPVSERKDSPLDVFEDDATPRRWPRVLAVVGAVLVLLVGGYVGASYALAHEVPRGATVAGVDIGGMSADEAEQALVSGLADRTAGPVPVVAQDVQAELDPAAAGLALDAHATVARLTGVDLMQPVRLWRQIVGVREQPPVSRVDETALEGALTELSGSLVLAPVDGTVVFADGAPHATQAVDGWDLDVEAAADALADGWLTEPTPVELPTAPTEPAITQAETDRVMTQVAQPLAAAPVTVHVADRQATLDVPTLTSNASFAPVDGTLELQLDGQALTDALLGQLPDLLTTAADARFEFQDGSPVIVPGVAGTTLDPAAVATAVADAATSATSNRLATVGLVESDPAQTTAALEALGVKEVVSEFSTPLTSEPRRTSNIATGLRNITGTLVRPGETFSLTEALGPVDAAHGFVQAGAIVNGEHADAWGGGLSQVSTTTYNAAYFAGFEDVEHTPHSEWFQRYPEGREATIFTGVIDMKWKNNTPYGALVQGYVADGRATVRIWSTKHFTVETEKSGRSGVVSPTTVYSQSATCSAQSAGNPGFTVTNTRRVYLDGQLVDTESNTWRYKPQNRVVCGNPPPPDAPPTP